jgi:hypothetical protein
MHYQSSVCLASPLHDPEGKLLELLQEQGEALVKLYKGNAFVSVSAKTTPAIIELLKKHGFQIRKQTKTENLSVAANYLAVLKMATKTSTKHIHLLDFDRALHWVKRFPRELRDVIEILPTYNGYVSFIRTPRAFQSHPQTQRTTETIVNTIASEVAGVTVDIMSGSFGFERTLAQKIVKEAKRKDYGIYAETLLIALRHRYLIATIEVEGLEWETPDQFKDSIQREGYTAWLYEFESLPEWKKRVTLLENSADVLINK